MLFIVWVITENMGTTRIPVVLIKFFHPLYYHIMQSSSGSCSDMVTWLLSKISFILLPLFFKVCTPMRQLYSVGRSGVSLLPSFMTLARWCLYSKTSIGSPLPTHQHCTRTNPNVVPQFTTIYSGKSLPWVLGKGGSILWIDCGWYCTLASAHCMPK